MQVQAVPYGEDNFSFLLFAPGGSQVAAFDCGEALPLLQALQTKGLSLTHLCLTHHHHDHVGGTGELLAAFPQARLWHPEFNLSHAPQGNKVFEGEQIPFGEGAIQVMATPYHTRTSVCYRYQGHLFAGDSLFVSGCGRLFEGRPKDLHRALERFVSLPESTLVHVGHDYALANLAFAAQVEPGNPHLAEWRAEVNRIRAAEGWLSQTTIGQEKKTNPFFRVHLPELATLLGKELSLIERLGALRELRNRF